MKYPALVLTVIALALVACAAPGQPPNAGNALVGITITMGGDAAIAAGVNRLNAAYVAGKVSTAQFNALYALAVQAKKDVGNLGAAIAANQPVTQAQVDTAVAEFLVPLIQFVPTELPPPATRP